jgi:DNA/RNA endonuclease YhcR with UshA esterase domain
VKRFSITFAALMMAVACCFSMTLRGAPAATAPATTAPSTQPATVDATDTATLTKIANGGVFEHLDRNAVVDGTVSTAEMSSSGKVFRIKFTNSAERGGFIAVYFPNGGLPKRMEDKFGGKDGSGLAGKHVRIHGKVEMYQNQPEIRISDPNQIEVVQ